MKNGINISVKDIYDDSNQLFMIKSTLVKEPGFRIVDEVTQQKLHDPASQLAVNKDLIKVVPHETKPPARYNQATLIKLMKEVGIGRPSTYASTTDGLIKFGYLVKDDGRLLPTEMAVDSNTLLLSTFPEIIDTEYTAKMEEDLDSIALAKLDKNNFLIGF